MPYHAESLSTAYIHSCIFRVFIHTSYVKYMSLTLLQAKYVCSLANFVTYSKMNCRQVL